MKAFIFPNPYIPGGPLGKVEIPGSRASSRTMVLSMLDWLRYGGQRQRHQSRQHPGPAGKQLSLSLAGQPLREAKSGGGRLRG